MDRHRINLRVRLADVELTWLIFRRVIDRGELLPAYELCTQTDLGWIPLRPDDPLAIRRGKGTWIPLKLEELMALLWHAKLRKELKM